MAIAFDAVLGTNNNAKAVTTTAAAASGSRVFLLLYSFGTTTSLTSVSGGGLTWVVDRNAAGDADNTNVAIASADAPAGLASSTTITATVTAGASWMVAAFSFTGLATGASGYLTGTPAVSAAAFGGSTTWTSPSITTTNADSLLLGACGHDGSTTITSAAGATFAEVFTDLENDTTFSLLTSVYKILTSAGANTTSGTFNEVPSEYRKLTIAYKAVAGVVAPGLPPFDPIPFMSTGRI